MRGWFASQMKEFMIRQPGVVEVEWNQVKYKPGDAKDEDEDEDELEAVGKGKKRRKKAPKVKLPKPKKKPQRKAAGPRGGARGKWAGKDEL